MGRRYSLKKFLDGYEGLVTTTGDPDLVDYHRFSIDSRNFREGQMFIALRGERFDAHQFVEDVVRQGARGVVVDEQWFWKNNARARQLPVVVIVVKNTLDFLQQLAAWNRRQFPIPVVALTGTSGKTTTREMIAAVMGTQFRTLRNRKNENNQIGVPLTLLHINPNAEAAVVELGTNQPGEIPRLAQWTAPTHALVTNIGPGHIGYFGSLEAIYKEKTALLDLTPSGGMIFLNMDDPLLKNYRRAGVEIIRVGSGPGNDVWGAIIAIDEIGCVTFRVRDEWDVHLQVPGKHQFSNALMAIAVGEALEIDPEEMKEALETFRAPHQRMEMVTHRGVLFINDAYNANPDSTRAAIDFLTHLSHKGKKIVVFGDMLELGALEEQLHREIGEFLAQAGVDEVLLYGDATRATHEAIREQNPQLPAKHFDEHSAIASYLQERLHPGDVVLIKGSRGMAMERVLDLLTGGVE